MIVAEYANIFLTFNHPFLISPDSPAFADGYTATLTPQTRPSEPVRMPTINKRPVRCYHVGTIL